MSTKMTNPPEPERTETVAHGSARPRVLRGKVLVGAGMLEPTRTFTWRGENFTAGKTRVAPEHPVCASEAAALLVPCWSKEDDPRVLEVYERATGRRWDATSRASAPTRTTAGAEPLYGTPEYHRHRQRLEDDGAAPEGSRTSKGAKGDDGAGEDDPAAPLRVRDVHRPPARGRDPRVHREAPREELKREAPLLPQPGGCEGFRYSIANSSSCPSL
jgi:hypothetical protein